MIDRYPDISFIIPFRNEELFLDITLDSLSRQELGEYYLEVLLFNGMSSDQSCAIANKYVSMSSPQVCFKVIENPRISVPHAYNTGIQISKAPIIGFGGAHTICPPNYIKRALDLLKIVDADVIGGGHSFIRPMRSGVIADAIGCLYLSPMGAGVASYHRLSSPAYVDTVYGGFYRRDVFSKIGFFNEKLARNQDNELNARVTSNQLRIYYHPDLDTEYIQKTDLRSFFLRAFIFGSYHPVTWWHNTKSFRIRHAVPLIWVLYLMGIFIGEMFLSPSFWLYFPFFLYCILLVVSCIKMVAIKSFGVGLLTIPLFFVYHILYGIGTLYGGILLIFKTILR